MTQDTEAVIGGVDPNDPFDGCEPLPGLEHLGRAIVGRTGLPSGSPANYEETRGQESWPEASEEEMAAAIAAVAEMLPSPPEDK